MWISNWCASCGGSPGAPDGVRGTWPTFTFRCRRNCGVWTKNVEAEDIVIFYEMGQWMLYRADCKMMSFKKLRARNLAERDALEFTGR